MLLLYSIVHWVGLISYISLASTQCILFIILLCILFIILSFKMFLFSLGSLFTLVLNQRGLLKNSLQFSFISIPLWIYEYVVICSILSCISTYLILWHTLVCPSSPISSSYPTIAINSSLTLSGILVYMVNYFTISL